MIVVLLIILGIEVLYLFYIATGMIYDEIVYSIECYKRNKESR